MKRLFAAIKVNPDENFQEVYYKLRSKLKNEKIKWVDLNNAHITLKFFGETEESEIPLITEVLNQVASQTAPFILTISNIGIFGSYYKPKVIWFGLPENEVLLELGHKVLNRVEEVGFKRDRQ